MQRPSLVDYGIRDRSLSRGGNGVPDLGFNLRLTLRNLRERCFGLGSRQTFVQANSEAVGESRAGTVSRGAAGLFRCGIKETRIDSISSNEPLRFSDDDSGRTAVIARCGMESSAACRSEGQGNKAR